MTGRRGRRSKQLLIDLKKKREYCKLRQDTLDCSLWRTGFGRGNGPVERQTTNEWTMHLFWLCRVKIIKYDLKSHYATNWQVAGSIPNGVIGIIQSHNPFGRTMALRSTQPLTEMSTRCICWGKGGRCVRLTLPPSCAVVMKSGKLNFLEPSGLLQACNGTALP